MEWKYLALAILAAALDEHVCLEAAIVRRIGARRLLVPDARVENGHETHLLRVQVVHNLRQAAESGFVVRETQVPCHVVDVSPLHIL